VWVEEEGESRTALPKFFGGGGLELPGKILHHRGKDRRKKKELRVEENMIWAKSLFLAREWKDYIILFYVCGGSFIRDRNAMFKK